MHFATQFLLHMIRILLNSMESFLKVSPSMDLGAFIVQTLSSRYGMRASNCEQSMKISGEGYFDVKNVIGRGPQKINDRCKCSIFAAY